MIVAFFELLESFGVFLTSCASRHDSYEELRKMLKLAISEVFGML